MRFNSKAKVIEYHNQIDGLDTLIADAQEKGLDKGYITKLEAVRGMCEYCKQAEIAKNSK